MVTQELISYIQQEFQKGADPNKITSDLTSQGWTTEDIREALRQMENLSQNQVQASSPPPPSKSKSKIIYIVASVIVVLFMVLALGGFYVFKSKVQTQNPVLTQQTLKQPSTLVSTPSTEVSKSSTASLDATKDWLVYKNTKVGFEFRYPARFSKPIIHTNQPPSYLAEATGQEDNVDDILFGQDSSKGFLLGISPKNPGITLNDLYDSLFSLAGDQVKNQFVKKAITVDGVNGLRGELLNSTKSVYFLTSTHHFIALYMNITQIIMTETEVDSLINSFKFQNK